MRVLVIGATSAIAQAVCRKLARAAGYLVARDRERRSAVRDDLVARGVEVSAAEAVDFLAAGALGSAIRAANDALGGIDLALVAHGTLPDQALCQASEDQTRYALDVNAVSVIGALTILGEVFEPQGRGTIAVISSPAGDRGRQSNYVYGAAKSAVSVFAQGFRDRLHGAGVTVLTIKPGFVSTPMTSGFQKGPLWVEPDRIAEDVLRAVRRGKSVCYSPWYWRYIMLMVQLMPGFLLRRLGI